MVVEIVSGYEIDGATLTLGPNNTVGINLANENTWIAPQTFSVGTTPTTFITTETKVGAPIAYFKNSSNTTVTQIDNNGNAVFNGAITTYIGLNVDVATTSVTGTTAGSIIWDMPLQGAGYKKAVVYLDGYENDTTTAQTITFPTAFTYAPNVYNPGAVPGVTASTTALSIDPDTTTAYTAWIFVEGF